MDLLLVHFPPVGGCGVLNCNVIKQQWLALQVKWNHCRCATISMRFRRLESFFKQVLVATNKTRALGVSNFCVSCFKYRRCAALASVIRPWGAGPIPVTALNRSLPTCWKVPCGDKGGACRQSGSLRRAAGDRYTVYRAWLMRLGETQF